MKQGGHILSDVLMAVMQEVKPGVTELQIDQLAEKLIRERGGNPGFMEVPGYKHTICAATNDVVVHGIPGSYVYKPGDMACVDCGVYLDGLHTDMAETILVPSLDGSVDPLHAEKVLFLETGKRALSEAISVAVAGNRIGHISAVIQRIVEKEGGYSVVRNLIGHGVGKELHEDPEVPGYLDRKIEKTPLLKPGMTIAIEIIYNMGGPDVVYANADGWTISTEDGSLSAVFERSILIAETEPFILTA